MTLTEKQQKKVEENMGLVHQVIHDKVHGYSQWGFHTYDDLFQIGCIGLCKAAATDKGGTFSTYAYRLIWHELCDALIQSTKRYADEVAADVTPYISAGTEDGEALSGLRMDLSKALSSARKDAERMGASARLVCAWVSKARKFLKDRPETEAIAVYCS